jgi:hypothetical protein
MLFFKIFASPLQVEVEDGIFSLDEEKIFGKILILLNIFS